MKGFYFLVLTFINGVACFGQSAPSQIRLEAEYYVAAYAKHYGLPVAFVRAVVDVESSWQPCPISKKGAVGIMQLMPLTAGRLGVQDRCNMSANISGGVRYIAWLYQRFKGDLRLVAAAYIAGEDVIARRGLPYRNPEVFIYVSRIRKECASVIVDSRMPSLPAEKRTVQ